MKAQHATTRLCCRRNQRRHSSHNDEVKSSNRTPEEPMQDVDHRRRCCSLGLVHVHPSCRLKLHRGKTRPKTSNGVVSGGCGGGSQTSGFTWQARDDEQHWFRKLNFLWRPPQKSMRSLISVDSLTSRWHFEEGRCRSPHSLLEGAIFPSRSLAWSCFLLFPFGCILHTYFYRVFRLIGGVFSSKNVCKSTFYQERHFSFKVPAIRRVVKKVSISRMRSVNNLFFFIFISSLYPSLSFSVSFSHFSSSSFSVLLFSLTQKRN